MIRRSFFVVLIAVIVNVCLFPFAVSSNSKFELTSAEKSYLDSIKGTDIKFATSSQLNCYVSDNGKIEGLLAPFFDVLVDDWGLSLEIVDLDWEEAFRKLDAKEIDLFGTAILTDVRKAKYSSTSQIYSQNMDIYTRAGEALDNMGYLNGKTLGMLTNSVLSDVVKIYITSEGSVKYYPNINSLITALENGEVDCIATSTAIQKELIEYPDIRYNMTVDSVVAPQGMFSGNDTYSPLIKLINRYLDSAEGEALRGQVDVRRKEMILELYRQYYAEDIKYLQDNYDELIVFDSGSLYPLTFVEDGKSSGLQTEINDVFQELTNIKINTKEVKRLDEGIETALKVLREGGDSVAITGVYYCNMLEKDPDFKLSAQLKSDKVSFYVRRDGLKKDIKDMNIGTTRFAIDYMDWKLFLGKMPSFYNTRDEIMDAVRGGEVDAVFVGEMNVDYYYTVLDDYTVEQFSDISIPTHVHVLYNSKNESFNKLMDLSIMLNSLLNPVKQHMWTDVSQNEKFDLMRLRSLMLGFQTNTSIVVGVFFTILLALLVIVVFQLKKFTNYDRQITRMLSTQGNVDMLWGNLKNSKLISKGDFPIFKKWGVDSDFGETLCGVNIIEESFKHLNEEDIQFFKKEMKVKLPNDGTDNYIDLYTHKLNEKEFMMFALDITAERYKEKELNKIANTDFLSKLLTRRAMDMFLLEKSEELLKNDGSRLFMLMLDIDNFKNVNDSYGHDIGDKVLVIASQVIRDHVCGECAARWGGEEFLVALEAESTEKAVAVAEAILRDLAKKKVRVGSRLAFNITISCGISEQNKGEKYEEAVIRADKALYIAKSDGKNCVRVINADDKIDTVFVYKKQKRESSLVYNKVISKIIKTFFYNPDSRSVINELLEIVTENTGANSANLFEKIGSSDLLCTHSYNVDKVVSTLQRLNTEYANADWDISSPMFVSDTSLIEADSGLPPGLKAYVRLPIFSNDEFKGVVQFNNFDEPYDWSVEERHVFTDVSVIIGEIITRKNIQNQLIKNDALFAALDSVADIVYVVEHKTQKLLFVNKAVRDRFENFDINGRKCREILYPDSNGVCDVCKHDCLSREEDIVKVKDKVFNRTLDTWLEITHSLVGWGNGVDAVVVVCRDIGKA